MKTWTLLCLSLLLCGCAKPPRPTAAPAETGERAAVPAASPTRTWEPRKKTEIAPTEKKVVMIIARKDFRDEELLKPKELLESRGAQVTVACSSLDEATGMLGAKVKPDLLLDDVKAEDFNAIVFVGGVGAKEYWDDPKAHALAKEAVARDKVLAAICLAPVTLANAGVLEGRQATVWASESEKIVAKGASYRDAALVRDGKILTSNGPEAAQQFGAGIASALGL